MAATNGLPEDPALLRQRLAEVEARYAQSQVQFRELRTWYDKLKRQHRELLWSEAVLEREGLAEAVPGPPIATQDRANGHIGGGIVLRHHLGAGTFATVYENPSISDSAHRGTYFVGYCTVIHIPTSCGHKFIFGWWSSVGNLPILKPKSRVPKI